MNPVSSSESSPFGGKPAAKAIVWGGLLAGILDLIFAAVYFGSTGATFVGILKSVAAGWMGKTAIKTGGVAMAGLGLASHFFIAIGAAAVFWAASRKWPVLVGRAMLSGGLIFGAGVYFFMNMVVMPFSAYHAKAWPLKVDPWVLAAHLFLIGLPIALMARRFSRPT